MEVTVLHFGKNRNKVMSRKAVARMLMAAQEAAKEDLLNQK